MLIAIIMGTRPEFIKLSPIIKECDRLGLDYFIIHTGQHYSHNMDKIFFDQLDIPKPKYYLGVGSGTYAEEVSRAIKGIETILKTEQPSIVLGYGDTNACISGVIAGVKLRFLAGHLEAGLRSNFSGMPEEINRVIADHCSDLLFAPTQKSKGTLIKEGISEDRIYMTGNTVVDAIYQNIEKLRNGSEFRFAPKQFALATIHRQENTDDKHRLSSILDGLEKVSIGLGLPIVYPVHPRANRAISALDKKSYDGVWMIEPVGYFQFLHFEMDSKLILTDSGGVQEEACVVGTPCVTLRDNTERPETIDVGANLLAGIEPNTILNCAREMVGRTNEWANPFGDGKASEKIIGVVRRICG